MEFERGDVLVGERGFRIVLGLGEPWPRGTGTCDGILLLDSDGRVINTPAPILANVVEKGAVRVFRPSKG